MCDDIDENEPWVQEMERNRHEDLARIAASMEETNCKWVLWVGPVDGITRPFCAHLAGLAIPYRYAQRMLNGRGRPVLEDAGGLRCRHQPTPLTEALIEALGIQKATDEQINEAVRAAGRERRGIK